MNLGCKNYHGNSFTHQVVVSPKERGEIMTSLSIKVAGLVILQFLVILFFWGCSSTSSRVRTGSIPDIRLIDERLHQGVSTRADVQTLLGKPNGYGGALLPTDPRLHDVWFYSVIDSSAKVSKDSGSMSGMTYLQMDFLLIFFEKEVYDGHMWFKDFTSGPIQFH